MGKEFKPFETTTIDGQIEAGKNLSISESSLAFKTVVNNEVALVFHNVITKYYNVVQHYLTEVTLTETEMLRYKCKPNLYCYDLYGTPELATSLLYVNNMVSVTEFKKYTFYKFNDNIMKIVHELMTLNEVDLKKNRIDNGIK